MKYYRKSSRRRKSYRKSKKRRNYGSLVARGGIRL